MRLASIITPIIISSLTPLILGLISSLCKKSNEAQNVLSYPKFYVWIASTGISVIVILVSFALIKGIEDDEIVGASILLGAMGILLLLGIWLFFNSLNWQLTLEEHELIHRNLFGTVKSFKYSEITRIVAIHCKNDPKTPEKYCIHVSNKKIVVEYLTYNFIHFERLLKRKLKQVKSAVVIEKAMHTPKA